MRTAGGRRSTLDLLKYLIPSSLVTDSCDCVGCPVYAMDAELENVLNRLYGLLWMV
jgi:hypothetical protein